MRTLREQRYVYVSEWDEVSPGFAYALIDLEVQPDEIWTFRENLGDPDNPPRGWTQTCPSCKVVYGPAANFCTECGTPCTREATDGPLPFDRAWGDWLDAGHDWSWRRADGRTYARVNNSGASAPGFWLVLNFFEPSEEND
jgi:hypothetical protein